MIALGEPISQSFALVLAGGGARGFAHVGVLRALDQGPLAGNTIVVLWSDHGYHLGQKEHWEKFALWEQTTRVPFIVVAPGVGRVGEVCGEPVSLLDIYPTLNELCGFGSVSKLNGESLVPLLRNPKLKTTWKQAWKKKVRGK